MNNIEQIKHLLDGIKTRGWVKTLRAGDTGIGYTLETLLNISENNLQHPDFLGYELKSKRKASSNSMMTMFTLSPLPVRSNNILRDKYGYNDNDTSKKILHTTLSMSKETKMGTGTILKLYNENNAIHIGTDKVIENIYWNKERIEKAFNKKIKNNIILVNAETKGIGKDEEFLFNEAFMLSGFNFESFMTLIQEGKILIDLRIGQYPNGKTHDHGTAFRIKDSDKHLLFKNIEKLI